VRRHRVLPQPADPPSANATATAVRRVPPPCTGNAAAAATTATTTTTTTTVIPPPVLLPAPPPDTTVGTPTTVTDMPSRGVLCRTDKCRVGSAGGGATVCLCGVEWGGRHGGATPWMRGCRDWTLSYLVAPRRDVAGVWAGDGVLDRLATSPRAGRVLVFLRRRDVRGLTTIPPQTAFGRPRPLSPFPASSPPLR